MRNTSFYVSLYVCFGVVCVRFADLVARLDDDVVALGGVADVAIAAVDNALIAKWVRI